MKFELSPLLVWISLWIVNTHSEFQVNIFRNNIYKMSRFLLDDDNDDAKAITLPRVFSENSRAKNAGY